MPAHADATTGGVRASARQLLASLVEVGRTRLELASVELEEERLRLAQLWIASAITLFLLFLATVLAGAWIVALYPAPQRPGVLGVLCLLALAAGLVSLWRWQRLAARRPPLLHATLSELDQDRQALAPRDARHDSP